MNVIVIQYYQILLFYLSAFNFSYITDVLRLLIYLYFFIYLFIYYYYY